MYVLLLFMNSLVSLVEPRQPILFMQIYLINIIDILNYKCKLKHHLKSPTLSEIETLLESELLRLPTHPSIN